MKTANENNTFRYGLTQNSGGSFSQVMYFDGVRFLVNCIPQKMDSVTDIFLGILNL